MASITIRNLQDSVKSRLRIRAARKGHSMEEEAREILKTALAQGEPVTVNFADAIRRHIEPLGGVNLNIPPRQPVRRPSKFFR